MQRFGGRVDDTAQSFLEERRHVPHEQGVLTSEPNLVPISSSSGAVMAASMLATGRVPD